jgi:YidC/Oxa1 family membrane protein insertase
MDKKSLAAFALIFIIILMMPQYFKLINKNSAPRTAEKTIAPKANQPTLKEVEKVKEKKPSGAAFSGAEQATHLTIDTDLYTVCLSSVGGGSLTSFVLKNYDMFTANDTTLVEMIKNPLEPQLLLKYISIDGDSICLDKNFTIKQILAQNIRKDHISISGADSAVISFILSGGDKQELVKKTLTFFGNNYTINIATDLRPLQSEMATKYYNLAWDSGLSYTEPSLEDEVRYSKAYAYSGGGTEDFDVKANKTTKTRLSGQTMWTAIRTKYFAAAFIVDTGCPGYQLGGTGIPISGRNYYKKFGMQVDLPVETVNQVKLYLGPLDYTIIKKLGVKLENIMSLGKLLRPISKGILWTFINLKKVIPNYGWVLIIFSLLIKILLHPLTRQSMQSMKEMQNLQPKIEELRLKYKNEPQKMSSEQMKLYKEHGVNPMGGCLPILLQMPILIALFTVFRTTIELRHAPFIWWITDLSAPDTIYTLPFSIPIYGRHVNVLPIIMALSTILQQKISGTTSTNPQQKMMMYLMPIMFFFMFNQFPSGLNLYYTLFNVLTVLQQKYLPVKAKPKKKKPSTLQTLRQIQSKRRFK